MGWCAGGGLVLLRQGHRAAPASTKPHLSLAWTSSQSKRRPHGHAPSCSPGRAFVGPHCAASGVPASTSVAVAVPGDRAACSTCGSPCQCQEVQFLGKVNGHAVVVKAAGATPPPTSSLSSSARLSEAIAQARTPQELLHKVLDYEGARGSSGPATKAVNGSSNGLPSGVGDGAAQANGSGTGGSRGQVHGKRLNAVHLTAAVTRLASFEPRLFETEREGDGGGPECDALLSRFLSLLRQRAAWTLDARGVANCLWALARLATTSLPAGSPAQADCLHTARALVPLVARHAHQFNAQQTANALWAIATLQDQREGQPGQQPGPGQEQGNPLGGDSGQVGESVDAATLELLLRLAGERMAVLAPQGASAVLWACARLQLVPDAGWLGGFFAHSAPALPAWGGQAVGNALWALARLGASPPQAWLKALYAATEASLGTSFNVRDLAHVAWSLATRGVAPPPERWMRALFVATERRLGEASGQGLSTLLWGLARLSPRELPPAAAGDNDDGQEEQQREPASAGWKGAPSGAGKGRLDPGWRGNSALDVRRSRFAAAAGRRVGQLLHGGIGGFSDQGFSNVSWALARLGFVPERGWLAAWAASSVPHVAAWGSQSLSSCLWALAVWQQQQGVGGSGHGEAEKAWAEAAAAELGRRVASDGDGREPLAVVVSLGALACQCRGARLLGPGRPGGAPGAGPGPGPQRDAAMGAAAAVGSGAEGLEAQQSAPDVGGLAVVHATGLGRAGPSLDVGLEPLLGARLGAGQQQQQQQQQAGAAVFRPLPPPQLMRQAPEVGGTAAALLLPPPAPGPITGYPAAPTLPLRPAQPPNALIRSPSAPALSSPPHRSFAFPPSAAQQAAAARWPLWPEPPPPHPSLVAAACAHVQRHSPCYSPPQLATALWALAHVGSPPHTSWLRAVALPLLDDRRAGLADGELAMWTWAKVRWGLPALSHLQVPDIDDPGEASEGSQTPGSSSSTSSSRDSSGSSSSSSDSLASMAGAAGTATVLSGRATSASVAAELISSQPSAVGHVGLGLDSDLGPQPSVLAPHLHRDLGPQALAAALQAVGRSPRALRTTEPERTRTLVQMLGRGAGEMPARGLAVSLWGAARLGFRPDGAWQRCVWRAVVARLPCMRASELALCAWALASMRAAPPAGASPAAAAALLLRRVDALARRQPWRPRDAARLLHAAAAWRLAPPEQLWRPTLVHLALPPAGSAPAPSLELVSLMLSAGRLGLPLPAVSAAAACRRAAALVPELPASQLLMLLEATALLKRQQARRMPSQRRAAPGTTSTPQLPPRQRQPSQQQDPQGRSPADDLREAESVGRELHALLAAVLREMERRGLAQLGGAAADARFLRALALLRRPAGDASPPAAGDPAAAAAAGSSSHGWLDRAALDGLASCFFAASASRVASAPAPQLLHVLFWLGRLRSVAAPSRDDAWMRACLAALSLQLPTMPPSQLSWALLLVSRSGHRPGRAWVARYLGVVLRRLPSLRQEHVCRVTSALARVDPVLHARWCDKLAVTYGN